jgi:hypothetical protein
VSSQRGLSLSFNVFLAALEKRGQHRKAELLKRRVTERFRGVLSEKEVLALKMQDIVGVLDLYTLLLNGDVSGKPVESGLTRHIRELERQGYNVVLGERYRE